MVSFREILPASSAAVGVAASDKDSALAAAVELLASSGKVPDAARLLAEVKERESLSSTGIGEGVAVPHALCESVRETVMCALRLRAPIPFQSIDEQPVDLIFLMAGPRGDTANHLKILSKLARLLHDPEFRKAARSAPDGPALAALLHLKD
jgi:fructose-specific phosphotransferase system IIA component